MSWRKGEQPAPRRHVKEKLEKKQSVNKVTNCGSGLMVDREDKESDLITFTYLVESFGWYPAMVDKGRNCQLIAPINEIGMGQNS